MTDQAGIYAGDKGFDLTVKDNTDLKGAVIDSKGSAGKNTLRTGTLSWEDVENKVDYKAGGMGISYAPKDSTIPHLQLVLLIIAMELACLFNI